MTSAAIENLVIGGGVVGLSVALGLLKRGHRVAILDGQDSDLRASHGNFGLTWMQGKGARYSPYAHWTCEAIDLWPDFAREIAEISGVDPALDQSGGFEFFIDQQEYADFASDLEAQTNILGAGFTYQCLEGETLRRELPGIGSGVAGATFCPRDGHVNPLRLLSALRIAVQRLGGDLRNGNGVRDVTRDGSGFFLRLQNGETMSADRVFLCAGLGAMQLAPKLGFRTQIRAQRGELLITERLATRLPFLSSTIRQVDEGGVQIGGTKAEVGPDDGQTLKKMRDLARHATTVWPALRDVNVVRGWGALRIMTQDGYPVYARAPDGGQAYLITCHSGVTLASVHCNRLPLWLDDASDAPDLEGFRDDRF